jgi:hypothetical protein
MVTKRENRWNLFAQELEEILAGHQQTLRTFNPKLGFSAEKGRRLQQSLLAPGSLPVLTPEELEAVELELSLSGEEWIRLRAALLATAIERMLMYRIGKERALQAVEHIIPLIGEALREQIQTYGEPGSRRGPDFEAVEDTEVDLAWAGVWEVLDSAALALQMSCYVSSYRERVRKLKDARGDFQEALDRLNDLDNGLKSLPIWEEAQKEAQKGLDSVAERLDDLGEI